MRGRRTVLGGNPRDFHRGSIASPSGRRVHAREGAVACRSPTASLPATRSRRSSSATRTSSPRPPARRSPSSRRRPTTRSSSTAASVSARPICSTPSATRSARLYPHSRLLYLSTERFTNELINAIRYDRTAEFRAKYRDDRSAPDRRHPVHLRQGADAGRVLPHLQRSLRGAEADRRLRGLAPQGDPRDRGAPALALRVGPDRGHPAARLRDAGRHPEEEGRDRAGPAARRRAPT